MVDRAQSNLQSQSLQFREQGNTEYKGARRFTASALRVPRLWKALDLYTKALSTAQDKLELALAYKNIAAVEISLFYEQEDEERKQDMVLKSCRASSRAIVHGSGVCHEDWKRDMEKKLSERLQLATSYSSPSFLRRVFNEVSQKQLLSPAQLELANSCFQQAVVHQSKSTDMFQGFEEFEKENHVKAISLLNECMFFVHEVNSGNADRQTAEKKEELSSLCFLHLCISEARIHCGIADRQLHQALLGEEDMNIDGVWTAVDTYRHAITLIKDQDLELEAIVLTKLGQLYEDVLKMPEIGLRCYRTALDLVFSMHPRVFDSCSWYKHLRQRLHSFQEKVELEEECKKAQEKAPWLKELEKELESLKKSSETSWQQLLKTCYASFPPKNPKHRLTTEPLTADNGKGALRTAIVHYHPDKQSTHGRKWQVLCEEITILLNSKYAAFK